MKIIQRYFIVNLVWTTFLALVILVGIFAFLSLIDQLEDSGQGNYGTYQAVTYVVLTLPRLAYEILPIAAMIGGMTSLALLAGNRELNVIRLSGVSVYSLAVLMGKSALVVVLFSIFIGEFIVPASEIKARYQRSVALTEQVAMRTKYGFWARDGNSFINIRKILPGNIIEEIYIYEFDDEARLRNSIFANNAQYLDNRWVFEGVEKTVIDSGGVRREQYNRAAWDSWVDDELINLVIINPQYMGLWNLYNSIRVLKSNSQNTATFEQALYGKLIRPFTIIAMIVLSIPLVVMRNHSGGLGQHAFNGALIGVVFYFCNSASSHIGIVYGIHPFISAAVPTLLLLLVLFWLFFRQQSELFPKTDHGKQVVLYQTKPRETQLQIQLKTRRPEKTAGSGFSSRVARRLWLLNIYARRAFQGFAVLFSIARRNRNK